MTRTVSDSAQRLNAVREAMAAAARMARRPADAAQLIVVSKTQPVDAILPLIAAGQRQFGENRVQEAQGKWLDARNRFNDLRLHLIGQLQSNKAAAAVALFDAIHTLDRPSVIDAVARAMAETGRAPDLFVQVNIGEEPQKGGCAIADLSALLDHARGAGLAVMGLMAVPPADREAAPYFALLRKLAERHGLPALSMGMSDDFETAIQLGATHVRVGSRVFGPRAG